MTDFASDDRIAGAGDHERTDADLIHATRGGDRDAFAALWLRHLEGARRVARAITRRYDPDDLASEAFAKVYRAIRAGSGPDEALMPYLAATIRNTAASWGARDREIPVEDPSAYQDAEEFVEPGIGRDSVVSSAFLSLPERWREALWYSEVEGYTAAEIGRVLGLSPNAAAALTYRAREGLKTAWVQVHLESVASHPDCRFVTKNLGAYVRGGVSPAARRRIERHVKTCPRCRALAGDASALARRLQATVVVGAIAATGIAGLPHATAPSATAAAVDAPTGLAGLGSAGKLAGGGAAAASLAAAIVALVMSGLPSPADRRAEAIPPAAALASPVSTPPVPVPPSPTREHQADEGAAPARPSADASRVRPRSVPSPEPRPAQVPPNAVPRLGPTVLTVDAFRSPSPVTPVFSGRATPGAAVVLSVPGGSRRTLADADGRWMLPPAASHATGEALALVFRAQAPGREASEVRAVFEFAGLELCRVPGRPAPYETLTLEAEGLPGHTVELDLDGAGASVVLDADGTAAVDLPWPAGASHRARGRYVEAGQAGPWFEAADC